MNKQSWREILRSFRDNYHILISAAILGFVFGASIAIMERIEGSTARMSQSPPVRSLTRTKEVKVTVTSKPKTSQFPSASRSNFRSPSHKSPEPLSSPYSSPRSSEYRSYASPRPTKTFSQPIETKAVPKIEKSSIAPTYKPRPTETKTVIHSPSASAKTEVPVESPTPVTEPTQSVIEEDLENDETNNPPDNGG